MNLYGPLIKYGLIALAVIGLVSFYTVKVYERGEATIQAQWDLDKAHQVLAAKALADRQAADTAQLEKHYADEIASLKAVPVRVVHDRVVRYVDRLCHGTDLSNRPVSVPKSPGGFSQSTGGDATIRPVDDLQHDIQASERNSAALKYCIGWVRANGVKQ